MDGEQGLRRMKSGESWQEFSGKTDDSILTSSFLGKTIRTAILLPLKMTMQARLALAAIPLDFPNGKFFCLQELSMKSFLNGGHADSIWIWSFIGKSLRTAFPWPSQQLLTKSWRNLALKF